MVSTAIAKGLNVIAITDHDRTISGLHAMEFVEKHSLPLIVIPGVEITTLEGHLLGLNMDKPIGKYKPMKEAVELVHEAGGLAVISHPEFKFPDPFRIPYLPCGVTRDQAKQRAIGNRPDIAARRASNA